MAAPFESLRGNKQTPTLETIEDRIARLELRLEDGFVRIGEAMNRGRDVDHWERHWIQLLREYESLQDELIAAA